MDAIDLLKKQQAENRERFAMQSQPSKPQELYRYIGFDAESGMAIASNGTNTIQMGRITNGAIKPNQPVKVTQTGNRAIVDAMPSPKPQTPATATQTSYPIKLVSAKRTGNRIEYYVSAIALNGQCKFNPRPVYTFEVDEELQLERCFCQIDSTGQKENDWILSIAHVHSAAAFGDIGGNQSIYTELFRTLLQVNFSQTTFTIAAIRHTRSWELSSDDDPKIKALFSRTSVSSGSFYKGHGFWAIAGAKLIDGVWQRLVVTGATQPDAGFAWYEGERTETTSDRMFVLPGVSIPIPPSVLAQQISYCDSRLQSALIVGTGGSNTIVTASQQTNMPISPTLEEFDVDPFPERLPGITLNFDLSSLTGFLTRTNYVRDAFYCLFEPSIHLPPSGAGKQRRLLLYEFVRQDGFVLRRKRSIPVSLPIPEDHLRVVSGISFELEPTIETIAASYHP